MDEGYNFKDSEGKWIGYWKDEEIYSFDKECLKDPQKKEKLFSIDTPPPTVSGKMHIGHAFSYSQQDFIARFRRMNGDVFYPFGTDDNGLPTERLVEKINNVKSKNMSREEFIKLCLKTLEKITPDFIKDWKNLGISADYNLCYSTINPNSQKISQNSFIELFKKGEVYKKKFPTIWCPECQTAIAQAEIEDKKKTTSFITLKFKVEGSDLLIATTRPELLPACVAVFVNPADDRYKSITGKMAVVPLFNHEVPIIADKSAEIEKGTGVLMICSYGDRFDVDAINKHKLTPKIVMEKNGSINALGYEGLKTKEARSKITQALKENELVTEQQHIDHFVNVHDKCGTEIEFVTTEQWFIKILDKKDKLIETGNQIKWYPKFMFKRYENWIRGLEWDWSISRDRHFGIPIPAWHCRECDKILVADEKELPVDPLKKEKKCSCGNFAEPEDKVLDTWATSSLTPLLASSLVDNKIGIPFSLRPQAHDIIRTWAFYTIVKAYLHENKLPWNDITVSGFVTLGGQKMSKSKGNVIEPQAVVEKYGADALRYWAAGSKLGEDLDYQEKDIVTGKKFVTKIFNATKFAFMNMKYEAEMPKLEETDRIFLCQLNKLINSATEYFEKYEYAKAKAETDYFFWYSLCDNYIEIVKHRVYNGSEDEKKSAFYTLYNAILTILKLMAPITPFITEELYQQYYRKNEGDKSIHISHWPKQFNISSNEEDDEKWKIFTEILSKVRNEKGKMQKSMKAEIILTIEKENKEKIKDLISDLISVTTAKEIKEGSFNIQFI
ncbi:MAG: valine--tRNA ligase [archaeon]